MDKHPHEKLLDQIAQILQFAYDNANKPIPSEKEFLLAAQLDDLEKQVMEFKKVSDKILEGSGLTDYVYETMKEEKKSSILSENERALLERAEFLKSEAQAASQDLQQAAREAKEENKQLTDKKKTKKGGSRKGKFRSFGGVKNWKPL
ncbi:MAG: hypothetical protein LLG04_03035 [Parachlamydia sp.]|nr:hypothetical protein [Parachlamydia sp.]